MRKTLTTCVAVLIALGLGGMWNAAAADELELNTGEVLHGQVIQSDDQQVVLQHPVLGQLTIPRSSITRLVIEPPVETPGPAQEVAGEPALDVDVMGAADEAVEITPVRPGLFEDWDSQLSLGFSGTQGDNRTHAFNTQFKTRKEDDLDRWLIDASYFYGVDAGVTTQNTGRASLTKDWLMPESPWFLFATGQHQYDQFRPWRHRTSAYGGVGYELIKREDLELIGRLGVGTSYEYRGDNRGFTPEALLGASLLRWNITDSQTLTGSLTLYPNLEDRDQFRVDTGVEWLVKISRADGLSIKLGVENQYESHPGGDSKRNNFRYYGAIVLDF